jgi:ribonucleoside-diphosphate reductase alpha chain
MLTNFLTNASSGITSDQDVRFASSLVDYVFRRLALDYLPPEQREQLGIKSVDERKEAMSGAGYGSAADTPAPAAASGPKPIELEQASQPHTKAVDAPLCYSCGSKMQPAGSCYVCTTCGSTSGCS